MRQQSVTPGSTVTLVATRPTTDQYLHLRAAGGAGQSRISKRLKPHWPRRFIRSAHSMNNQVVGCGRIVGDGGLYFYVEDLIVEEASRGAGIGGRIHAGLAGWLSANARDGALVSA